MFTVNKRKDYNKAFLALVKYTDDNFDKFEWGGKDVFGQYILGFCYGNFLVRVPSRSEISFVLGSEEHSFHIKHLTFMNKIRFESISNRVKRKQKEWGMERLYARDKEFLEKVVKGLDKLGGDV